MDKLLDAKKILANELLDEIFSEQILEVVDRFKEAKSDDVPTLVACNIEARALERLKESINEKCQAIVDESAAGVDTVKSG